MIEWSSARRTLMFRRDSETLQPMPPQLPTASLAQVTLAPPDDPRRIVPQFDETAAEAPGARPHVCEPVPPFGVVVRPGHLAQASTARTHSFPWRVGSAGMRWWPTAALQGQSSVHIRHRRRRVGTARRTRQQPRRTSVPRHRPWPRGAIRPAPAGRRSAGKLETRRPLRSLDSGLVSIRWQIATAVRR